MANKMVDWMVASRAVGKVEMMDVRWVGLWAATKGVEPAVSTAEQMVEWLADTTVEMKVGQMVVKMADWWDD